MNENAGKIKIYSEMFPTKIVLVFYDGKKELMEKFFKTLRNIHEKVSDVYSYSNMNEILNNLDMLLLISNVVFLPYSELKSFDNLLESMFQVFKLRLMDKEEMDYDNTYDISISPDEFGEFTIDSVVNVINFLTNKGKISLF